MTHILDSRIRKKRIHLYWSIIVFVDSLWIHYQGREITMYAVFPMNKLWFHDLFRVFTINSLSLTRIHDGSIILSENSELIYYLFCILIYYFSHEFHNFFAKFILHSQFDSQINNEFAIFERSHCSNIFSVKIIWINYQSVNLLWIHYRYRQLTMY